MTTSYVPSPSCLPLYLVYSADKCLKQTAGPTGWLGGHWYGSGLKSGGGGGGHRVIEMEEDKTGLLQEKTDPKVFRRLFQDRQGAGEREVTIPSAGHASIASGAVGLAVPLI